MSKKSKNQFYVVWVGNQPGIYDSWDKCLKQVSGFANAKYMGFTTLAEAQKAFKSNPTDYIGVVKKEERAKKTTNTSYLDKAITSDALCVDASCSGNPGTMEYRGVDLITKQEIFKNGPFEDANVNIGEFLAIVHAMSYLEKKGSSQTIFSDSRTAISWVHRKKINSTIKKTSKNSYLFELIHRALNYLQKSNYQGVIVKWDTQEWGEIPADYGRK